MAKSEQKYLIPYKSLLDSFQKGKIPNNILLSLKEKVLLDDLIKIICEKFAGKGFCASNNLAVFNAEDRNIEGVLNECSNMGLFSDKKIVVLKNVKKLLKDAKLALIDYLKRSNPDTCLIMTSADDEFAVDKIFLFDSKTDSDFKKENKDTVDRNVKIFEVSSFTESDIIEWIGEKFDDYKISKDAVKHFLQFTNYSLDEILSEIEKLKTYCYFSKEVTIDAINLCNGIARDFNEMDFIKAIVEKDNEMALRIYDKISLRKDVEIFLIFLMSSAFMAVYKLYDPAISGLNEWQRNRELKLWYDDQKKLLPYYINYRQSVGPEKIISGLEYIYNTDKLLKTSGGDRRTIMITLINNICSL